MQAAAYDRARKLWTPRQGAVLRANVLGVIHSLLILGSILVTGGLVSLVVTQGQAWFLPSSTEGTRLLPSGSPIATRDDGAKLFTNTGLLPIVENNQASSYFTFRGVASVVGRILVKVPTLRNNQGALATLLAINLAIFFVLSVVARVRRQAVAVACQEPVTSLRRQLHRQLYRLGQSSLPSEGTGPVMNLFTRDVNDIREALAADLNYKLSLPTLAVGLALFVLVISWDSWESTIFLGSLGLLTWLAVRQFQRSAGLASVLATREAALQLCLLQEDFGLIRTVRVHGVESYDKERFDEHLERLGEAEVRRVLNEAKTSPTIVLIIASAIIVSLGLLAVRVVINGYSATSALLLLVSLLILIRSGLLWMELRRLIEQANRSAEGIFAYLERKPELHQAGGAMFLPPLREKISFENVTLENGSGKVLLEGLTVEIAAKTKTSIMALDEEVKTALVCLIPRLIDPKVGRIRIDGVDIRDVTLESVRSQVATVLQADLVFSDSVIANIALGDSSYDLPRIIEAAKVAHAHHFIHALPNGYDTVIGPLGEYLKPDQQYRIALARAFLHDPAIVIIEEPEGPLEDEVKAFLDDTLARLAPGRTLIMLPHRLSTIRSSDRVILIHNGRLEAAGSPTDVKSDKLFKHLQYVEFNQFAAGEIEAGQMGG
jgi:ABC-type multidrug transport system fused ATPase/permease subunit